MATLDFLPATTYRPPTSPVQAQKKRRALNTIMEDDEESMRGSKYMEMRGRERSSQKADWLSPLSDHFPTPRANHFIQPYRSSSPSRSDSSKSSTDAPSSAPWTRTSFTTDATDFDDLYDVSSDEDNRRNSTMRRSGSFSRQSSRSNRSSTGSITSKTSLPALVIPNNEDPWAEVTAYKLQLTSPVPPTPPPKVAMSPAVLSYLKTQQNQPLPSSSTPPSLDGSMDSEQMAQLSAPPTPDIGYDSEDDRPRPNWGVQLQPSAMATLEAIAGSSDDYLYQQPEQVIQLENIPEEIAPVQEMQQRLPPLITNLHRHNSVVLTPGQQRAMEGLTNLEIPSPGGFFASLGHGARHTWHLVPITPDSPPPPSSTTAENFYATPWAPAPVERIVEVSEPEDTDGPPTAKLIRPEIHHDSSEETIVCVKAAKRVEEEIVVDEMLTDYAPGYINKLEDNAAVNLDRTALWLAAQNDFLSDLINPTEARDDEVALLKRAASTKIQVDEVIEVAPNSPIPVPAVPVRRKTVRFNNSPESNSPTSAAAAATATLAQLAGECPLTKAIPQESTFHRAFKRSVRKTRRRDVFVHRVPRFEAIQSQRVSFPAAHRAHLLGKYQLSVLPMSPKRRMSSNVARGDDTVFEDPEKLKDDKEVEALEQMTPATWNVMAAKLLNGGRLIAAPVAKRLARLSSMGPTINGTPRDRARILDLGGQATCDWAWHCATEYPNCKVYTVTTKSLRQLSNSNIRGPKNLRQVAVDRLVKLPWKDNQFDLISAREIYSILKERSENGEDEWEACLNECMRILKPGGYLEFSIMDSDIVNAGPMGLAKSVEFGFNLKTLGYDPSPTKLWLGRLKRAGFVGIKRAWVFLPMGADPQHKMDVERNSVGDPVQMEAMVSGSTDDAACVTGLVGGWAWEKWMLRCRIQTVGDEGSLEGVQHLIEEGRACGAGWRTVNGWARKPLARD
jgi:SAM-dependent methyltransferase